MLYAIQFLPDPGISLVSILSKSYPLLPNTSYIRPIKTEDAFLTAIIPFRFLVSLK